MFDTHYCPQVVPEIRLQLGAYSQQRQETGLGDRSLCTPPILRVNPRTSVMLTCLQHLLREFKYLITMRRTNEDDGPIERNIERSSGPNFAKKNGGNESKQEHNSIVAIMVPTQRRHVEV